MEKPGRGHISGVSRRGIVKGLREEAEIQGRLLLPYSPKLTISGQVIAGDTKEMKTKMVNAGSTLTVLFGEVSKGSKVFFVFLWEKLWTILI